MIRTIENEYLIAQINEFGAEMFSLKSKITGTEILWQGNSAYWVDRAPTLFPICGRLVEGKYTYKGKVYEMGIHGFAKACQFSSKLIAQNEIEFTLLSNENTKQVYPFDFKLSIKFKLVDNQLVKTLKVTNVGEKVMPFSFGGHPGFNVPIYQNETFNDYYIEFSEPTLNKIVMSEKCSYTGKIEKYPLIDNKIMLKHDLFDNDALFFEIQEGNVKLKSQKSDFELEMSFNDMTCLGLWHKPTSDAPYVCIEPWHGVPADDGVFDDLETKRQMIHLGAGKTYENTYKIKIRG
ncbi:MAG: aldose 1-epimerase family protein [Clostridia bacterium]|nr:aldose 1-epimerase family protein [Clostridia bacterium]